MSQVTATFASIARRRLQPAIVGQFSEYVGGGSAYLPVGVQTQILKLLDGWFDKRGTFVSNPVEFLDCPFPFCRVFTPQRLDELADELPVSIHDRCLYRLIGVAVGYGLVPCTVPAGDILYTGDSGLRRPRWLSCGSIPLGCCVRRCRVSFTVSIRRNPLVGLAALRLAARKFTPGLREVPSRRQNANNARR